MNEALAEYLEARDALDDLGRRYRAGEAIPVTQVERAARRKVSAVERMRCCGLAVEVEAEAVA